MTLFEAQDASEIVSKAAGEGVNIIFGTAINPNLGDEVVVTVIATGIDSEAEEKASKVLPGRGKQVKARPQKAQAQAPAQDEQKQLLQKTKSKSLRKIWLTDLCLEPQ